MAGLVRKIVDCVKGGEVLASYPISYGETLGTSTPPTHAQFIAEAKTCLAEDGKALPPFEGVEFIVRDAR